jgi:lactoylglutathione lyase
MRPFRILGIQQIAVGGPSKERLRRLWIDCFGLTPAGNFVSERENVDEDIAVMGTGIATCEVDLMQPLDPAKKPAVHEPPLNHVGLWVDDLPKAVEWLAAQGVRFAPGGIRKGAAGHDITFIHPRGNDASPVGGEGVLIELVQAPADVIAAFAKAADANGAAASRGPAIAA